MGTLRKTWHLRDEDILYVEENHDGKYGAPGKKRQPKALALRIGLQR